jgi:hypothetical protein
MRSNVLALIPAYTHIDFRLLDVLQHVGLRYLDVHGSADLVRTRSRLLTQALASDAQRFLLIDSDIVPSARDLVELIESPRVDEQNAVSGCYVVRENTLVAEPEEETVELFGRERFVPMLVSGLGFAAVHRDPLERMKTQLPRLRDALAGEWYPFCLPLILSRETDQGLEHEYLADDYSFWWRLRLLGVRPWIDTHLVVGHVKKSIWRPGQGGSGANYVLAGQPAGFTPTPERALPP